MTDPKGSESKQTNGAATEKKPAARRTTAKKTTAGNDTAKKTTAKKTAAAAPAETPAAEASAQVSAQVSAKTTAKKTAAGRSAKTGKDAAAKPATSTAKKTATPSITTAPAETASATAKAESPVSAPAEKPAEAGTSGRAAGRAAKDDKNAGTDRGAAAKSAPKATAEAPTTAPAENKSEAQAPADGTTQDKAQTPARSRGRAPRKTAVPSVDAPPAAPSAASVKAEPKPEATTAAPTEAKTGPKPEVKASAPAPAEMKPEAHSAVSAPAEMKPEAHSPASAPVEMKPEAHGAASAPAESGPEAKAEAPQKPAQKRSSRGRGRAPAVKRADAETAAPAPQAPAAVEAGAPAEASAATETQEGEAGTEERGERKRRGRSRRGRRKSKQAREAAAETAATSADDPLWGEAAADVDPVIAFNDMADEDDVEDEDEDDDPVEAADRKPESAKKSPRRKMFVCVQPDEQVEVVISEEGQVQEYYVEMLHQAKTKGNIYKAAISNVDANLQAAFVSYGAVKNGFLQIDEVHPEYYVASHEPGKGRKYPPIQKVLKPGQEVLVQVVKEPTGTKGAFLTTYLSLAGRFLVLTPGREQIGVSRKVENEAERARLREMLNGLTPGPGLGVIVRTVSMGVDKSHLEADLEQLKKRWTEVRERGTTAPCPTLIHQEMELVARAVRDYLTDQVVEVWVDDEKTAKSVAEVAAGLFPRKTGLVRVHGRDQTQTLFERFNIQRQVEQIHSREVTLPSGGRLVIDPTEALTAIDINSGRSGGKTNFEDMAFRTNLEAARMIPLQLRLRDIGGQIVVDFIEMRDKNHWREVEKAVRQGMKVDRARYDVGKIGPFGMLEIVRQRLGSSAISVSSEPCPHCKGTGVRRNMEWQSQQSLREIQALMQAAAAGETPVKDAKDTARAPHRDAGKDAGNGKESIESVIYEAEPDLAMHLLNQKRRRIAELEQTYGLTLEIHFKHPVG